MFTILCFFVESNVVVIMMIIHMFAVSLNLGHTQGLYGRKLRA